MISVKPTENNVLKFDLIMLGGGISASLLAINLLKKNSAIQIAIVEKSTEFNQKVGESTSDITAICLRSMGIDHLLKDLIPKTGLRFLYNEKNSGTLSDEIEFSSPSFQSNYTGFQINRKKFDQQLLDEAEKLGAVIFRPAELKNYEFKPFHFCGQILHNEKSVNVESRWFLDGSGRARFVHKQLNWSDSTIPLNTGSVFAHFTNLTPQIEWQINTDDYWKKNSIGDGSYSTIHFMRPNAWWWFIRIDEKTTSIGIVYDKKKMLVDDPETFLQNQIDNDAQLKRITQGSQKTRAAIFETVPYKSEQLQKDGVILIGDSAAMVDPFLSPGIELICQQVLWLSEILTDDFHTKKFNPDKWKRYEKVFSKAIMDRMIIYAAAYPFLHSYDLSKSWIRAGLIGYFGNTVFMSVLIPSRKKYPFRFNFFTRAGFNFMIWRLNKINEKRKNQKRISQPEKGKRKNTGVYYSRGIGFYFIPLRMISLWLRDYIKLEWKEFRK